MIALSHRLHFTSSSSSFSWASTLNIFVRVASWWKYLSMIRVHTYGEMLGCLCCVVLSLMGMKWTRLEPTMTLTLSYKMGKFPVRFYFFYRKSFRLFCVYKKISPRLVWIFLYFLEFIRKKICRKFFSSLVFFFFFWEKNLIRKGGNERECKKSRWRRKWTNFFFHIFFFIFGFFLISNILSMGSREGDESVCGGAE